MKKLIIYLVPLLLFASCGKPKDEIQKIKTPEEIEQEKEAKREDLEVSMVTTTEKGMEPQKSLFQIKYGEPGNEKGLAEGEGLSFTTIIRVGKDEQVLFYFKTGSFVENVKLLIKKDGKPIFDPPASIKHQSDGFDYQDTYRHK